MKRFLLHVKITVPLTLIIETWKSLLTNHIIKEERLSATPEDDSKLSLDDKHKAMIIEQAHRDLGFNGPVFVRFSHHGDPRDYASLSFFSGKGKSALVVFPDSKCEKMSDEITYAIAGHEAAHSLHHHQILKKLLAGMLGALIRSPISLGLYIFLIFGGGRQLMEIDADITSAKTLNTAKYLIEDFSHALPYEAHYTFLEKTKARLIGSHPLHETRIGYLAKLNTYSSPLLFQSEKYHKILQEREKEEQDEYKFNNG